MKMTIQTMKYFLDFESLKKSVAAAQVIIICIMDGKPKQIGNGTERRSAMEVRGKSFIIIRDREYSVPTNRRAMRGKDRSLNGPSGSWCMDESFSMSVKLIPDCGAYLAVYIMENGMV